MDKATYTTIEAHMLHHMRDSAHDPEHIYRVLYNALDIAARAQAVDYDVLLAACLLHDIGRNAQYKDKSVCHAEAGAQMAQEFLSSIGFDAEKIPHICACISTHRFRGDNRPQSLEARILFDADKLDVVGVLGLVRGVQYLAHSGEGPLYATDESGNILNGADGTRNPSLFHEYHRKLKKLYGQFYTPRGQELALEREKNAKQLYKSLYNEVTAGREAGMAALETILS